MSGMLWGTKKECLNSSDTLYNYSNNYYYPLFDKINKCYKNESIPDGYYLTSHIF